ncbi:MAG: tRNA(Met) cytidine acetyltransferase [Chromatiales bacterium]|nr:tRNA(Met) cytidine acetyltransferase [Gammaproteobacteria bacterium]MCP5352860.1 tRNA(Met) cytidine acetyltransferase [Chromatiales bacterium]
MNVAEFPGLLERLRAGLRARRHRGVLLCVGSAAWRSAIDAVLRGSPERVWRLGEALPGGMTPREARARLGQECDLLLVDARTGLDPDALGALGGTVVAGGLMILLAPPEAAWKAASNPLNARLAVAGWPEEAIGDRFDARLRRVLAADARVVSIVEGQALPDPGDAPEPAPPGPIRDDGMRSADQAEAVSAVVHVVHGQRRRPVVLTADRGRGKSAALGLAARALLAEGRKRILVTGPARESVAQVFTHAGEVPADAELTFYSPDELLDHKPEADLLLVDEAAAVPTGQLKALLAQYPRIAFATTVHGYEGTGRGFDLRFRAHLDAHTRGWRALRMTTPIRWAEGDPLEALLSELLLLDAEPASPERLVDAVVADSGFQRLDRDALVADEADLRQVFGLLVGAHYRTRPSDLRHLLDAPNVELFALRYRGAVAAVALVSLEGGFDDGMVVEIVAGRRRPHGHLLAEAIAAHCGFGEGAAYRGARVQRIAVHPDARRLGFGSALLKGIASELAARGVDYLGASFGATPELLDFWFRNGCRPLRLGYRHNAASGEPSALVLAGLSPRGHELAQEAGARFETRFLRQLADVHRQLDAVLADRLLAAFGGNHPPGLDARDWADIAAFTDGQRAYEEAIAPLTRLVVAGLTAQPRIGLSSARRHLLIHRVLQNAGWSDMAGYGFGDGRRALEAALRDACAELVESLRGGPPGTLAPPNSRERG